MRGFDTWQGNNWRANSVAAFDLLLQWGDVVRRIRVQPDRLGGVSTTLDASTVQAKVLGYGGGTLRFEMDGVIKTAIAVLDGAQVHLALDGFSFVFSEVSAFPNADALKDASRARSPVAGKVTQVLVAPGQAVQDGEAMVCVEAMKMEMWLSAQAAGTVNALHAKVGDQVESGALLVELLLSSTRKESN
jgi:geranyl-CoA carboxylase alpha subunit